MKDHLFLQRDAMLEGKVTIDYTDALTQKIKERIEGHNTVFPQAILCHSAYGGLWGDSYRRLLLTDFKGTPDSDLPLLPGNQIGYGYRGSAASGTYQGAERVSDRVICASGSARTFKHVFDWLPTQIPGEIGCIGWTPQQKLSDIPTSLAQPELAIVPNKYGAILKGVWAVDILRCYRTDSGNNASSPGRILMLNMESGVEKSIELTAFAEDRADYRSASSTMVGYEPDGNRVWLLSPWYSRTGTSSSNYEYHYYWDIYVFDSTLSTKLEFKRISLSESMLSYLYHSSATPFIVRNGLFYQTYYNSADPTRSYIRELNIYSQSDITSENDILRNVYPAYYCIGGQTINQTTGSMTVYHNGYVCFSGQCDSHEEPLFTLFDLSAREMRGSFDSAQNAYYGLRNYPPIVFNTLNGLSLLSLYCDTFSSDEIYSVSHNYPSLSFGNANALTRYMVPADAPKRPEGSGVTITYELSIIV